MEDLVDLANEFWSSLLRHTPLGILTDLDGTLVPFASKPEDAVPSETIRALVRDVATLPGLTLAIVSGRPREDLEKFFPSPRSMLLAAEHGAWRASCDDWTSTLSADNRALDSLIAELRRLAARHPSVLLERKTWSVAFHFRTVPAHRKPGLLVQLSAAVDPWLDEHPGFERLWGSEVLEVRPRAANKATAVRWVREILGPGGRLIVVGDDETDEDMFRAASENDATILVNPEAGRRTAARFRLESTEDVAAFYREVIELRRESAARPSLRPAPVLSHSEPPAGVPYDLLVVSNRLPVLRSSDALPNARQKNVGGLVSALQPVLTAHRGIWLGWSGRTRTGMQPSDVGFELVQGLSLASVDLPEDWHRHYYNGFSNGALWPLFHSFPERARFRHEDWRSYVDANGAFASIATKLVAPEAVIWAHDYHLLLLAQRLRSRGHRGPIGLFQHIPFPGPDVFFLLPWAHEILDAILEFDLVGFHTRSHVENFLRCLARVPGVRVGSDRVLRGDHVLRVGAFPLGIMPDEFRDAPEPSATDEIHGLLGSIGKRRLVLGVDRLDYTKGISERIDAFGRLLELFPEWRKNVCFVQVSVPTRADIPDYAAQRERVENSVGRVNGEFGEADWVPIRYLYRSYGRPELSQLYKAADVGYVTPLRDGMNLVAKEFVAAQNPDAPGVLVLSRFAGAAEELCDAILTNPWDQEGTARDLDRALHMTSEERKRRHAALAAVVSRTTALTWAEDFLAELTATRR